MWHASIALLEDGFFGPGLPKPIAGVKHLSFAKAFARDLLFGVGMKPDRIDLGQLVVHLRRALSDYEIGLLDPEWVAIPAVDSAGSGNHLRRIG